MSNDAVLPLSDVRRHLRFPNPDNPSTEDAGLTGFRDAALEVVAFHCNDVVPALYDEYYDGGSDVIYLRHRPLLEVVSVIESWGPIAYECTFQPPDTGPVIYGSGNEPSAAVATNVWAYSIDDYEIGLIRRRTVANSVQCWFPGVRNIHVAYRAGRNPVPAAIRLAAKELIAHWYQNSQQRSVSLSGANIQYDVVNDMMGVARHDGGVIWLAGVPDRIIELLTSQRRDVIFA